MTMIRKKYTYNPVGVCCKEIVLTLDENNVIKDLEFIGGCPGNLNAIRTLLLDKPFTDFIGTFEGNKCGSRSTSCMASFNTFLKLIDSDMKGTLGFPINKEIINYR